MQNRKQVYLSNDKTVFGGVTHSDETLEEFLEDAGFDNFPSIKRLNYNLKKCGINPVSRLKYQYELLVHKWGDDCIGFGDVIHCNNEDIIVGEVKRCDFDPYIGIEAEFYDPEKNYHTWKSSKDGGYITLKDEEIINGREDFEKKVLLLAVLDYQRREWGEESVYQGNDFNKDFDSGAIPLAYSTMEANGEDINVQVNLDPYDYTIYVEIPEDLQRFPDEIVIVLEKFSSMSGLIDDVTNSSFEDYFNAGARALSEILDLQLEEKQER